MTMAEIMFEWTGVIPWFIDSALARSIGAGDEKAALESQSLRKKLVPLRCQGTPEEVANAVLLLASNDASYCSDPCLLLTAALLAGRSYPTFSQGATQGHDR